MPDLSVVFSNESRKAGCLVAQVERSRIVLQELDLLGSSMNTARVAFRAGVLVTGLAGVALLSSCGFTYLDQDSHRFCECPSTPVLSAELPFSGLVPRVIDVTICYAEECWGPGSIPIEGEEYQQSAAFPFQLVASVVTRSSAVNAVARDCEPHDRLIQVVFSSAGPNISLAEPVKEINVAVVDHESGVAWPRSPGEGSYFPSSCATCPWAGVNFAFDCSPRP